ncbi:hypothetical protein HIM_07958 [Hirsutella minnesotensis 3608]|uniref:Uncharacterized protein n=1 Tax=Hirsutella minnesotensis 3608 TaxID=1043627 RepID=A0A0F8A3X7_9HYPO|nr:hypothetical protein HIM_07958 [Hirsutella minnesotensis 3608]
MTKLSAHSCLEPANKSPEEDAFRNADETSWHIPPEPAYSRAGNNHVQSWLSQVHESNHSPELTTLSKSPEAAPMPWRPNNIVPTKTIPDTRTVRSPSLFVRDSPLPSLSPYQSDHCGLSEPVSIATTMSKHQNRRQQSSPAQPTVASGSSKNEYRKRPRRKTRPDRYDTVKLEKPRRSKKEGKDSRPKPRKDQGSNRTLRSEREVMENFTSGAIAKDRVTMKPNLTTGPFLNGRSSATTQPGDLEFYHIDNVTRRPKTLSEKPIQTRPGKSSHERRVERELEEDSNFFANVDSDTQRKRPYLDSDVGPSPVKATIVIGSGRVGTPFSHGSGQNSSLAQAPRVPDTKRVPKKPTIPTRTTTSTDGVHSRKTDDMPSTNAPTPKSSYFKDLIETAIFDDAELPHHRLNAARLKRLDSLKVSSSDFKAVKGTSTEPEPNTQRANYQDQGVMVSPQFASRLEPCAENRTYEERVDNSLHCGSFSRATESTQRMPRNVAGFDGVQYVQDAVVVSNPPGYELGLRPPDKMLLQVESSRPCNLDAGLQGSDKVEKCCQECQVPCRSHCMRELQGEPLDWFPDNRPRVQPRPYDATIPTVHDSLWTTANASPSDACAIASSRPRLPSDPMGFGAAHLGSSRQATDDAPIDQDPWQPISVAELEREFWMQTEMNRYPNLCQSSRRALDRDMIDLQVHELGMANIRDSELDGQESFSLTAREWTPAFGQARAGYVQPDSPALGSSNVWLKNFWRPNCLR